MEWHKMVEIHRQVYTALHISLLIQQNNSI